MSKEILKNLEEILQKYFGLKGELSKNNKFTSDATKSYKKFISLIYDLSVVSSTVNFKEITTELNQQINELIVFDDNESDIKTLESILQKYFGLDGNLFKKNYNPRGNWTKNGYMSYNKLVCFIYDLEKITTVINSNRIIDALDEIEWLRD